MLNRLKHLYIPVSQNMTYSLEYYQGDNPLEIFYQYLTSIYYDLDNIFLTSYEYNLLKKTVSDKRIWSESFYENLVNTYLVALQNKIKKNENTSVEILDFVTLFKEIGQLDSIKNYKDWHSHKNIEDDKRPTGLSYFVEKIAKLAEESKNESSSILALKNLSSELNWEIKKTSDFLPPSSYVEKIENFSVILNSADPEKNENVAQAYELQNFLEDNQAEDLFFRKGFETDIISVIVFILKNSDIKLIPEATVVLPLLLNLVISDFPERKQKEIIQAYRNFENKFHEVNKHSKDYQIMLIKYQGIFCMLTLIMEEQSFYFLRKYMASVLGLERLLENLSILPESMVSMLNEYFLNNKKEIISDSGFHLWEEILIKTNLIISSLEDINFDYKILLNTYYQNKKLSLKEFNHKIHEILTEAAFKNLKIDTHQVSLDTILKKFPSGLFTKLMHARSKMQNDEYLEVFDEMLRCDLLNTSLDDYMHSTELDAPLSKHNNYIRHLIEEAGINYNQFINYSKIRYFELNPPAFDPQSIMNAANALKKDCLQLLEVINLLGTDSDVLIELKKNLTIVVTKNDLHTKPNLNLFAQIKTNLETLFRKATESKISLPREVEEFSTHFLDRYQTLLNLINQKKSILKMDKPKAFEVRQWRKDNPHTYFLGNYVGCCLATDGAEFQALIQRRMDDAMIFHTVIDRDTNQPVALAWLYLAEDKDSPGKLALIANFLEITAKYGNNSEARNTLIDNLLAFTADYCNDVGIHQFLINHLSYGWIPDFTQYQQTAFRPRKIGGYLILNNEDEEFHSQVSEMESEDEAIQSEDSSVGIEHSLNSSNKNEEAGSINSRDENKEIESVNSGDEPDEMESVNSGDNDEETKAEAHYYLASLNCSQFHSYPLPQKQNVIHNIINVITRSSPVHTSKNFDQENLKIKSTEEKAQTRRK